MIHKGGGFCDIFAFYNTSMIIAVWCFAPQSNFASRNFQEYIYPWLWLSPELKDTERGRFRARSLFSTNRKLPYILSLLASYWLPERYKSESADPLFLYRIPTFQESTSCQTTPSIHRLLERYRPRTTSWRPSRRSSRATRRADILAFRF